MPIIGKSPKPPRTERGIFLIAAPGAAEDMKSIFGDRIPENLYAGYKCDGSARKIIKSDTK